MGIVTSEERSYKRRAATRAAAEKENGGPVVQKIDAKDPVGKAAQTFVRGVQSIAPAAEAVRKIANPKYVRPTTQLEESLAKKNANKAKTNFTPAKTKK